MATTPRIACSCACDVVAEVIQYCPLHTAAPELLEALKAVEFTSVTDDNGEEYDVCPCCSRELEHASQCVLHLALLKATKAT